MFHSLLLFDYASVSMQYSVEFQVLTRHGDNDRRFDSVPMAGSIRSTGLDRPLYLSSGLRKSGWVPQGAFTTR